MTALPDDRDPIDGLLMIEFVIFFYNIFSSWRWSRSKTKTIFNEIESIEREEQRDVDQSRKHGWIFSHGTRFQKFIETQKEKWLQTDENQTESGIGSERTTNKFDPFFWWNFISKRKKKHRFHSI